MPLSDRAKKILIWSSVILVSVGVITGILVFLLRKTSTPQTEVDVTVSITMPGNITKKASIQYDKTRLNTIGVGEFIGSVIRTSKIITQSPTDIFWNSMSLNSKIVQLGTDGQITDKASQQPLSILLGAIPAQIMFMANYKNSCPTIEKPTCDPCKGQDAVCSENGWVCVDGKKCPTGDDLYNCCATNPNGPYATCENGTITCGQCPSESKIDCGDPGCGLIGNMCTATGWICAPNRACPTGDALASCCTGSGIYAFCKEDTGGAHLMCSVCNDSNPPDCPPDCKMSGLVCGADGKFKCVPGTTCPPDKVKQSCCGDNQYSICDTPGNGAIVECKDCSGLEKPTSDPNFQKCEEGSCEGHGWVCTKDGWVCKPNQVCPSGQFDYKKCCPVKDGPNIPYCDTTTNCVKCSCPQGSTGCTNLSCGMPVGSCQSTCCPIDQPCHKDANGNCLCCPEQQICVMKTGDIKCCADNTVCKNNDCLPICGKDSAGQDFTCGSTQSCLEIDNLSADNIGKLKKEYGDNVRINGTSGFVCVDNKGCNFGNELAIPAAVANYYPCYTFPDFHDPDEPGPGYCTEKDNNPTGDCAQKYTNSKMCTADNDCTWRNVLKYMAGASSGDPKEEANQIEKELQIMQNTQRGFFCDPNKGTTPYSRIVAYPSDKNVCSWDDCWTRMAQPGVIDIEYNTDNGVCVALQSCNNPAIGMTSGLLNNDGNKVSNPNTQILPWNKSGGSSSFPDCNQKDTVCPISDSYSDSYVCIGDCKNCTPANQFTRRGQVVDKRYGCNPYNDYKCEINGVGAYSNLDACKQGTNNCCPPNTKHYNDACYVYNPPISSPPIPCPTCINPQPTCSGTDTTSPYNNFVYCHDSDHLSCIENSDGKQNIPQGVYYCQGTKTDDTNCGGRSYTGKWTLCEQSGGCKIHGENNPNMNTWYVDKIGTTVSYCSWPPPSS